MMYAYECCFLLLTTFLGDVPGTKQLIKAKQDKFCRLKCQRYLTNVRFDVDRMRLIHSEEPHFTSRYLS